MRLKWIVSMQKTSFDLLHALTLSPVSSQSRLHLLRSSRKKNCSPETWRWSQTWRRPAFRSGWRRSRAEEVGSWWRSLPPLSRTRKVSPSECFREKATWQCPVHSEVNVEKRFSFVTCVCPWQALLAGNPYWSGRISTVDLLILTCPEQLLFILKMSITFYKKVILTRRSTVLSLPLQVSLLFSVVLYL